MVDFRVRLPKKDRNERIHALCDSLVGQYSEPRPIRRFSGEIRFDDDGISSTEQTAHRNGYRLDSKCGKSVIQIRPDGFTFSRLRPYESWDAMIGQAWPIWERYVAELNPPDTNRVATRFVNVLPLTPGQELDRVLNSPPQIPDGLPSTVAEFLFRYVTTETDGTASIVSMATEAGSGSPSLLLDIDCFARGDFSVTSSGMDHLRSIFQQLRKRKNDAFFKTVAQNAMEQWK